MDLGVARANPAMAHHYVQAAAARVCCPPGLTPGSFGVGLSSMFM
jgi:hypothetical protein